MVVVDKLFLLCFVRTVLVLSFGNADGGGRRRLKRSRLEKEEVFCDWLGEKMWARFMEFEKEKLFLIKAII